MGVESYAFDGWGVGVGDRRGFEEVDYVGVDAGFVGFGCAVWGGVGDGRGVSVDWGGHDGGLIPISCCPYSSVYKMR